MNYIALFIGTICLIWLIILCTQKNKKNGLKNNPEVRELSKYVGPSKILTPYERKMHIMLREAIPSEYSIMCQVSFNAFLKCEDMSTRNKFNRMMLDFLIVDENFIPVLCIELDDFTHQNETTKAKDKFRDNLLSAAYIPTERFEGLPKNSRIVKSRLSKYFSSHKKSMVYKTLIKTK